MFYRRYVSSGVGFICVVFGSGNLTPHVLSEWMVEVCRFEVCVFGLEVYVLTPHVLSEWMVEV